MYKIKYIIWIICLFITSSIFSNIVYWKSCSYSSQIEKCITENWKKATIWPKWIEDFLCIVWTPEKITYQIVLDEEFKKVDKKMDLYIEELEKNKNIYFGVNKQKTYIEWVNDIIQKSKDFSREYNWLCSNTIIEETLSCMKDKTISIQNTKDFISNNWGACTLMIDKKIEIFRDVSFSILMLNKQQVKLDEKKLYDQWQRSNYDNLLDIMNINLSYIERIIKKTVSFISNTY